MEERIVRSKFGTLGTRETFRKGRGRKLGIYCIN